MLIRAPCVRDMFPQTAIRSLDMAVNIQLGQFAHFGHWMRGPLCSSTELLEQREVLKVVRRALCFYAHSTGRSGNRF